MDKKVIVVSGASGNLGKAIVRHFLSLDWRVIGLVHRTSGDSMPNNYEEMQMDLLEEGSVEKGMADIIGRHRRIDAAVLTAGGFAMGDMAHTSVEDLEKQYRLNFITAYNLAKPVFAQMKLQQNGNLFFTGSGQGLDTHRGKGVVAYSLAKSQLFQLANILNADAESTSVKTYVLVPNIIDTPQNRRSMPEADYRQWESPESIAKIVAKYTINDIFDRPEIIIRKELAKL